MTPTEAIDLARDALDRSHRRMKNVWIDKPIDDEELQRAEDDALFGMRMIAELRGMLKRT